MTRHNENSQPHEQQHHQTVIIIAFELNEHIWMETLFCQLTPA